jgi:hyperosmotically inducible periplasmic protein
MAAPRLAFVVMAFLLAAHPSAAQDPPKNFQLAKEVSRSVNTYAFFTIFDDISAEVNDGEIALAGKVTMPFKKTDLEKRIAKVPGVTRVVNLIEVLPVSGFDDELRYRIARSIYSHSNFWNYAVMANPPIHIVVERGRVTLTGVVQSDVDRALARALAVQFGAFSITNDLRTDAEIRERLETH